MYSFAQLLSSRRSGLYLFRENPRSDAMDKLCRLKGVRLFRVDASRARSKQRFLAAAARAMDFPDWFGANWDAFADCVTDLQWAPADAYVVLLENIQGFARRAPRDFRTALRILEEAAQFWNEAGVPFHVLVAGAQNTSATLPAVSPP
jgi:hypothetical protein